MATAEAAAWVGAVATFIAVVVALFKEDLRRWWRRPVLQASLRLAAPDCHKTELLAVQPQSGKALGKWPCYYFRLWVENSGNLRAEQVQVYASRLLRKHADGGFREDTRFLPMNLKWAHAQQRFGGREIFAEGISPKMGKHCDLGHIAHPAMRAQTGQTLPDVAADATIMELDIEVAPLTRSHLIPPGIYRLELRLAAANSTPVTKTLELTLTGQWHDEESKMFSDGVGLKDVS
jgi:hypothetical protein